MSVVLYILGVVLLLIISVTLGTITSVSLFAFGDWIRDSLKRHYHEKD
jgi:hypothetical protein